eukprot:jgi/Botrbrau1/20727/Bobra.0058s0055.2
MYAGPFGRTVDVVQGEGLRARGPRLLSAFPRPGWQRCELKILSVKEVQQPYNGWLTDLLSGKAAALHYSQATKWALADARQRRKEAQIAPAVPTSGGQAAADAQGNSLRLSVTDSSGEGLRGPGPLRDPAAAGRGGKSLPGLGEARRPEVLLGQRAARRPGVLPPGQKETRWPGVLPGQKEARRPEVLPELGEARRPEVLPELAGARRPEVLPGRGKARRQRVLPGKVEAQRPGVLPGKEEAVRTGVLPEQGEASSPGALLDKGENGKSGELPGQGESPRSGVLPEQGESPGSRVLPEQGESPRSGVLPEQGENGKAGVLLEQGEAPASGVVGEAGNLPEGEEDQGSKDEVSLGPLYEVTVQLMTGRTHQIRAQLSAIGAPIIGDQMYEPLVGALVPEEGPGDADVVAGVRAAKIVENPLGLHAARLSWRGHVWTATPPWQDPQELISNTSDASSAPHLAQAQQHV